MLINLEDANSICRSLRCLNAHIISNKTTDDLIVNKDIVAIWFKFKRYSLYYDNSELCVYKRKENNSIYCKKIYVSKKYEKFTKDDCILSYRMVIDGEDKEHILSYDDNFIYNFIKIVCEPSDYDFSNDESNSKSLLEETFLGTTHNILLKITRCFTSIYKIVELVNKINELSNEKIDNSATIPKEFIYNLRYVYDHMFSNDCKIFNAKTIWDGICDKIYRVIDTALSCYNFRLCNRIENLYNVYMSFETNRLIILNIQFYQKNSLYIGKIFSRSLEYDIRVSVYENGNCLVDKFIDYLNIDLPFLILDSIRKAIILPDGVKDEIVKETHGNYVINNSMKGSIWKPLISIKEFLLKYDETIRKRKDNNNE